MIAKGKVRKDHKKDVKIALNMTACFFKNDKNGHRDLVLMN
jgi:hypothetical protein